jgi:hypothetical protein
MRRNLDKEWTQMALALHPTQERVILRRHGGLRQRGQRDVDTLAVLPQLGNHTGLTNRVV